MDENQISGGDLLLYRKSIRLLSCFKDCYSTARALNWFYKYSFFGDFRPK